MQQKITPKPDFTHYEELHTDDLIQQYSSRITKLEDSLKQITEEQANRNFAPELNVGTWSCHTLIGHLADAEIVFIHRMRRIAAENKPVFAVWDENQFISNGLYGNGSHSSGQITADFLNVMIAGRTWISHWLRTLTPEQFLRTGLHPDRGEQTLRRVLEYSIWHEMHHVTFLDLKIKLLNKLR